MEQIQVLVVEDENSIGRVISRALGRDGCRVVVATSAEEALAYAGDMSFDIIFADISLPGMTGLQAIGELKARCSAPIIVMTGNADEEARQDALLLGATGFLEKPLDPSLVRGIVQVLPRTRVLSCHF